MEGGGVGSLTLDCEDMFKEITKKLYGEEATVGVVDFPAAERELEDDLRPEEHITAWGLAALMQNGFPPPGILQANFTPRIDPLAEDRWTAAEEPLAWAHSRVAAYNPAQRLFKCTDCECVGFLARVAEHWLGTHSQARAFQCPLGGCGFASGWARAVRVHLARDHHSDPAAAEPLLRDNPALDDLTRYLTRLKTKVESSRNERRPSVGAVAETGAEGAGGAGGAPAQQQGEAGKRYCCAACPYATDRRDLFTRHENIHRDEKPFHCYLCHKQFNRADHVKKHFLRMHRDQPYDLNRIRRITIKTQQQQQQPPPQQQQQPPPQQQQQQQPPPQQQQTTTLYYSKPAGEPPPAVEFRLAPPAAPAAPVKLERAPLKDPAPAPSAPKTQPGQPGERRYACCYCAWSGADNWCLKRHLNTHLKPYACSLCEYKAARAERLATHVAKVHNKRACPKCAFLADDQPALHQHLRDAHHIESRNLKVPSSIGRVTTASTTTFVSGATQTGPSGGEAGRRREGRAAGAARLFGYLEASDGSGDEYEAALAVEYVTPQTAPGLGHSAAGVATTAGGTHYGARDKENAAPMQHAVHHDHCLRY